MTTDFLKHFADQNKEHRLESCIGESISDSIGNLIGRPCDPDYTMAASFYVQGKAANLLGTNLYAAMLGAIAYGCLPETADKTDPIQTSELTEDTYSNYSDLQKNIALQSLPPSGLPLRLNNFADITAYLFKYKMGVPLVIEWHEEFNDPSPSRIFSIPTTPRLSNHCVEVVDVTPQGLQVKPHLGEEYGYAYIPMNVLPKIMMESYGFVPGNRAITLLYVIVWRIGIYCSYLNSV